ncbi:MAG: hypothetical protein LBC27_00830 [Spirochaetaceae bacterium]|nr:hypothetical protein [Spirochaetaceae bacterium]
MAKKVTYILVLAAFFTFPLAAQEEAESSAVDSVFSAGAGGFIGGDFGGGAESTASAEGQSATMKTEMPYFGGGGYVFFDAKYAELTLGIYGGSGKAKYEFTVNGESNSNSSYDISFGYFNIGLLGKYPFAVNQKFSVFPLLGIEYDVCFSAKDEDGNEYKNMDGKDSPGDFSALWFKFGVGGDVALTQRVYLRLEALYGFRLASKAEKDAKDSFDSMFTEMDVASTDVDSKTLLGHGLTAKLAVGYKF